MDKEASVGEWASRDDGVRRTGVGDVRDEQTKESGAPVLRVLLLVAACLAAAFVVLHLYASVAVPLAPRTAARV